MSYTFLKERFENEEKYFAIPADKVERLRASKTYDHFGQLVGTENTGDYIDLLTLTAVEIVNKVCEEQEIEDRFEVLDTIRGYDNCNIFDLVEEALEEQAEAGRDYDLHYDTCEGFDYHDGSNWQTVVVDQEGEEPRYEVITDEALMQELTSAIEGMEFTRELAGGREYSYEGYMITTSQWAGDWAEYEIQPA
jgi:hypothetical protein